MARIVKIGRHRWLAGLTWSSFEGTPSKDELKEDAQRMNASWVCVRENESVIQAGFCAPVDHIKNPARLYSLAAMLAAAHEQPWMGIFKIKDGLWWYLAVRDGDAILPDGDVIGSEGEARAAKDRHSGYGDWKYIEGDIGSLSELISNISAKPTPVHSLESSGLSVIQIVSALVLVLALGGGWWHHQQQLEEERARAAAIAKMRAEMLASKAAVSLPSPLLTTPQPNDWLAACGHIISSVPLSQYGWELTQVECDATSATLYWVRKVGATVEHKPEGVLSPQGDEINQIISLEMNMQGKNDAIDLPTAKLKLRAWAQTASFQLMLTEVAPPTPLLPGQTGVPQNNTGAPLPPPPPPQAAVELQIPISPFGIDMSSIPGLRLTSLKSDNRVWNIRGILYGRH